MKIWPGYTLKTDYQDFLLCVSVTEKLTGQKHYQRENTCVQVVVKKTDKKTIEELIYKAQKEYEVIPQFIVELIVVSGILQWYYEIQIFIGY